MPPRLGHLFQACSNVDTVAEKIGALHHDVADVDANSEPHAARLLQVRVATVEHALNCDRAPNRLDSTAKLGKHAVACSADEAPLMLHDEVGNESR